jgi:purine-nucleoside phosphorylase
MSEQKRPNFMKVEVTKPTVKAPSDEDVGEKTMLLRPTGFSLDDPAKPSAAAAAAPPPAGELSLFDRAGLAAQAIRTGLAWGEAKIAVVLGSGLSHWGDALEGARAIDYGVIPGFPKSTVAGHRGRLVRGTANGVPVYAMQGRFHAYEGYSLEEVTFPIRVFHRLGVRLVILTNAAGAVSERLAPGDLMVIDDHINLTAQNPLRGPNDERFGPRFPDMSEAYGAKFREVLLAAGVAEKARIGCGVKSGVYAALPGPSYETPAEIRMLARLGADAVGMSTVPEAIVANHMGMGVAGVSGIANMAAGVVKGHRLTHDEVIATMRGTALSFQALIEAALPALAKLVD